MAPAPRPPHELAFDTALAGRRALRRARRLGWGPKVAFTVCMLLSAMTPLLPQATSNRTFELLTAGGAMIGGVGLLAFVLSFVSSISRGLRPASVRVSPAGVALQAAGLPAFVPTSRIRSALAVMRAAHRIPQATVELVLDDGDELTIVLDAIEQADAVVDVLGFGPGGKRVEVDLASPNRRFLHVLFAYLAYQLLSFVMMPIMFIGALANGGAPAFTLAIGGLGLAVPLVHELVKRYLAAPVVSVGRDGVFVRRRLKRSFVAPAWGEQAAAPHAFGAFAFSGIGIDAHRRWAVWRQIARGAAVLAADAPPARTFERAGRDLASWRQELARAANDAGYRTSGLSPDAAARVLASAVATPEQRVGAALALRVAEGDPARIRVAAESCADEDTREALLAVADDAPDAETRVARALRPR